MLEKLKEEVLRANKMLQTERLAILTWGNVSARDEETGYIVIKGSGVEYADMTAEHLVTVKPDGTVVEGACRPSTDLATHLVLYRNFPCAKGVVHTHSPYATVWAQAGQSIPCYGTTHADYFKGDIPCTRAMTPEEINGDYEQNTGEVIVEAFKGIDPASMRAVLVQCHGPFAWGDSAEDAVHNGIVLENVAMMALRTKVNLGGGQPLISDDLMKKHYNRKFGPGAYYGQR